ncbi:MAG TPA: ATP-binding protein [Candidatus Eisenbacteria bacterium]|jgi:PAS domain S-box-containing protein|nr:ATP-binding protein [Candidatus Eisenbacteria bacterium]
MFHPANYFHNPYCYPPLAVGLLIGALGLGVFFRERRSLASFAFLLLTWMTMAWLLSYVGIFASAVKPVAVAWCRIEMVAVSFLPPLVLLFCLTVIDRLEIYKWAAVAGFLLSAWFSQAILLTDGFVQGVYEYYWGYYVRFGPTSRLFLFYFAVALIAGALLLWDAQRRADSPKKRMRLRDILLSLLVAYFGCVDFPAAYGRPVYPCGYVPILGFLLLSAIAIRRYHLVDITPAFAARQIIDTMADALLVTDSDGVVRVANPAACLFLGKDAEAIVGRPLAAAAPGFFPPEKRLAVAGGRPLDPYEIEAVSAAGRKVILNIAASAMRSPSGEPLAFLCIARDVTAYRQVVDTLVQKKVELARTSAEREQMKLFAYAASHDLREPLHKIISIGDLLRSTATQLDDKSRDYLSRMQNAAMRMGELIDSLLRLSRVSMAEKPFEPVDLSEAVRQVLSDLDLRLKDAGATVEVGALPSVNADRAQMYELFQNLVSNAVKFRRPGESPRVTLSAARGREGFVRVTVRDNGIGFEPGQAERIFRPFQRLHGRSEYEGHGLGLAICDQIVQRHGGRISAEGSPGEGAAFTVELPAAPAAPPGSSPDGVAAKKADSA